METITINVAEKTAKDWKNASPKMRSSVEKWLAKEVDEALYKTKVENLEKTMDTISEKVVARGMTEEILQEILSEND